jgi:hypothetical protein
MRKLIVPALILAVNLACTGRGDTGQRPDTEIPDTEVVPGFIINGTAQDIQTNSPAAAGLCAFAVDPSPVLLGGEPDILQTGAVEAGGAYSLVGVVTDSSLGILVMIDDCEGQPDTVYRSATGIASEDYENLGDGDVLTPDRIAYVLTQAYGAILAADWAAAGNTHTLEEGVMLGVSNAAVTTLYGDGNAADNLFQTGGVNNTATDAASGAFYVIPAAGVRNFAADDGGAHTWESRLAGSFAGFAVFVNWVAQ